VTKSNRRHQRSEIRFFCILPPLVVLFALKSAHIALPSKVHWNYYFLGGKIVDGVVRRLRNSHRWNHVTIRVGCCNQLKWVKVMIKYGSNRLN
jgi:hypothetical protein